MATIDLSIIKKCRTICDNGKKEMEMVLRDILTQQGHEVPFGRVGAPSRILPGQVWKIRGGDVVVLATDAGNIEQLVNVVIDNSGNAPFIGALKGDDLRSELERYGEFLAHSLTDYAKKKLQIESPTMVEAKYKTVFHTREDPFFQYRDYQRELINRMHDSFRIPIYRDL